MIRKNVRFLLFSVLLLGLCTTSAHAFKCGDDYVTYVLGNPLSAIGVTGVRCVKFGLPLTKSAFFGTYYPNLIWYGEGYDNWTGAVYRHFGEGYATDTNTHNSNNPSDWTVNTARGYQADIYGNGESTANAYPGNITLQFSCFGCVGLRNDLPSHIDVSGAINEEWNLGNSYGDYYTRLPQQYIRTCGPNFMNFAANGVTIEPKSMNGAPTVGPFYGCAMNIGSPGLVSFISFTTYHNYGVGEAHLIESPRGTGGYVFFPPGRSTFNFTLFMATVDSSWNEAWGSFDTGAGLVCGTGAITCNGNNFSSQSTLTWASPPRYSDIRWRGFNDQEYDHPGSNFSNLLFMPVP